MPTSWRTPWQERRQAERTEQLMAEPARPGATSFTRQQAPLRPGPRGWCAARDRRRRALRPDPARHAHPARRVARLRCIAQCLEALRGKHGGNIIAVEEVPPEDTHMYGIVSVTKENFGLSRFRISCGMVE